MQTALTHRPCASRLLVRRAVLGLALGLGLHAAPPALGEVRFTPMALRFGILPMGGMLESRKNWEPLLAELGQAIGQPVSAVTMGSYESMDNAIRRRELDFAFLSGKMALDAVTQHHMSVIVQVQRRDGEPEHRAVLLARRAPPFNSLQGLLAAPERWRIARGDSRSLTGFVLPQAQLFLPHGIELETRFRSELIGTHQETALAVANGDADVATNNTTDFERFRHQFPIEAARLQVIWTSEPTPPAQIVMRADHAPALQAKVQAFLADYGRARGPRGDAERAVLASLQATLGYAAADNSALLPVARLERQYARQRAMASQWVSEEARQARLARVDAEYAQQASVLRAGTAMSQR